MRKSGGHLHPQVHVLVENADSSHSSHRCHHGWAVRFLRAAPGLDTTNEVIFFHSIAIGIATIASYLVISIFELQKYEPPLDFPMSYRAFGAVIFAAVGGLLLLSPDLSNLLPDVPLGLFVVTFILIGVVGGATLQSRRSQGS